MISKVNLAEEWTAGNLILSLQSKWPFVVCCSCGSFLTYDKTDSRVNPAYKSRQSNVRLLLLPFISDSDSLKSSPCICTGHFVLEWTIYSEGQQTPVFPALKPLATHGVSNNRHLQEWRWSFSVLLESHQQRGDLMSHSGLWVGLYSPEWSLS